MAEKEQKFQVTVNKDGLVEWKAIKEKPKRDKAPVIVAIAVALAVLAMVVLSNLPTPNSQQDSAPRKSLTEID